jgi:polyhydroxyalkanoate synthesis repressor PhaR
MIRLIKRYESRKLYDTEESRYVSLDEIALWVRKGQEVKVIDNASSEDVTAQTLAQIILEEGRNGRSRIPTETLRDLVRFGERALTSGVEHVQQSMDRMVKASIDRLGPVRQAREEMNRLRSRLEELEESLSDLETSGIQEAKPTPRARKAPVKRTAKKTPTAKKTAKKTAKRTVKKTAKKTTARSRS